MSHYDDFLTKQLFIEKNVVTYRSVSRHFKIHVNEAKNVLANFNRNPNATTRFYATYWISGELFPRSQKRRSDETQTTSGDDTMDVDTDVQSSGAAEADEEEGGEDAPLTSITLVGEDEIDLVKARYARITSLHVYSLSPSRLTDAGFICDPSEAVYQADASKDAPVPALLGRVVGPDVRIGKVTPATASSSSAKEPISRKPTLKPKVAETPAPAAPPESEPESKPKLKAAPSEKLEAKPKATGKLDWSKAPVKRSAEQKKPAVKAEKQSPAPPTKGKDTESPKEKREETDKEETEKAKKPAKREEAGPSKSEQKRGTKRKSEAPPPPEPERSPTPPPVPKVKPKAKPEPKVKGRAVVSDDDEDEDGSPPPRPAAKAKAKAKAKVPASPLDSDAERSLRAMMDIDDDMVVNASTTRPTARRVVSDDEDDDDIEMATEPEFEPEPEEEEIEKPKPKKKVKKVVPVGRNGLKKKRIVKSRMTIDAKGYTVTEDYSEYESVDEEEEEEPPKKGKGKATTKAAATKSKKADDAEASPKPATDDEGTPPAKPAASTKAAKPKPVKKLASKANAQGSLMSFFGKSK